MIWAPLALAAVIGVTVSAGLYLVVVWPRREPDDDDHDDPAGDDPAGGGR